MNIPVLKKQALNRGLLTFILLLLVILAGFGTVLYGQLGPARPGTGQEEIFIIKPGATPLEIASDLEKQGLIKSSRAFLLYSRLAGKIDRFKAGQYLLSPSYNTPKIVDIIEKGKVATITFTIPEGYTLRQIADVLVKQGIATEEEFWNAAKQGHYDYPFLKDLPKTERRLEGYLFPDTYLIPKGMKVDKVIDLMLRRFDQVYKKLPNNKTGLTTHEVVTLASIVEGEAVLDKERPLIASVFLNRLKIGMKLDSDATIQYSLDKHTERVLYKDLEIDSPYNTYRHKGLPPGPIGSPGEASLRAVLEPAETKYRYFVAKKDGSGEHVFAVSLAEHAENKKKLGY
ncbi:MAG: endolytic transglycosylase MltG [Peptococcaceae bacterium]|jgi:UPF0755 protein|nr:endolytic transglycosylase MltG [Peptococcaceae bacterium]MDH7525154.1 endolytic transglycosylase MltG [Peptococcaceae bacterium]